MRTICSLILILLYGSTFSQETIEWKPEYKITLSDFKSPQTEINSDLNTYSLYSGGDIQFGFQMSNAEFMFTKSFNNKVKCVFNQQASILVAPDSAIAQQLIKMAQFSFDLSELYARKLRKELYERKGAFSSPSFFEPVYQKIVNERNERYVRISKETDMGENEGLLLMEHQKVLSEIKALSDFCYNCKRPKKKNK